MPTTSSRSVRRLRVLAVVQAALIIASLGIPIVALANVGTVTVNSASQAPSPVIQGSSATFTLTAVNTDVSTTRTFNATAVAGVAGLSVSSSTCATIGPGATGSITVTLATTAATPTGSATFTLTVADHNSPACTGSPQSTNTGTGTIVVAAKLAQTITFGPLANKRPDELPLTVSATASSGLTVTFTSATPAVCTVAGTTVSYVANGLCTIRANQAGNATYSAAPQVTQSFTIAKGNQTITFGALANKRPDELPLTVAATASSGLTVTFTSATPAVCTVAGTTVSYVANGLCTINANQAGNANWNAAPQVAQSFTIAKGNQTITFGALANKRPDELPLTVAATASSGLTVTFTSATPAVCTVAGTTVSYVANGLCTINANQAGDANWNAAPQVAQSFTIAKGNQTISFGALADKTVADPDFSISATASSGLAVTFSSATPAVCTVAGTTVHLVAAGGCTINADQAGDANWNAAPQVAQSFTVGKLAQTITFGPLADKRPDELPLTVAATASSGLAVTFTSATPAVCTVAGTTVSYVANGLCTINANQAGDANWNAAPQVAQSFTIAKGNQTISFGALADKTVADPDFSISATASSGLAVTFSSATPAVCTVAGTTVHLVAAGGCTIDADQVGDANWNAAPQVAQSFTVGKLAQTITFGPLADKRPDELPLTVAATASSGLAVTFTSATPAVCTVAGTTVSYVANGLCTINANQAGDANWNAAPQVAQSFTIAKGNQTISFGALADKTVADPDFSVSATASSGLAVTFSSATPAVCTVAGTTVHLVAAGGCTINADQAGDANWNAAPQVAQSFTVGKLAQTITFGPLADKRPDELPLTVAATASSGLAVTFTSATPAVCTVAGTTVSYVANGLCTINANQAGDANWNAAPQVAQSFTIAKGNQTISFGALADKTVADPDFSVSATASSGLAVTFSSATPAVCTVAGTTVHLVAAGGCTIDADQAGDANWNAAPQVAQSFTVGKLAQTITFGPLADKRPDELPLTVAATASSGLAVTFTSATPAVCTVAGTTVSYVANGLCTINANQAGDATYSAAPQVAQSFTIAKGNQTISFGALADKTVADPDFSVSATASSGLAVTFSSATPAVCTVAGTTVHLAAAGGCTINADQAGDANWNAAPQVAQSFTVNAATTGVAQAITFPPIEDVTFGAPSFELAATTTSGLPITFTSLTPAVCTVTGTTVTIVSTGTCTIQASQVGDETYAPAEPVAQSFAVLAADASAPETDTISPSAAANGSAAIPLPLPLGLLVAGALAALLLFAFERRRRGGRDQGPGR